MRRFFAHGRRTFRIALYRIHKLCFSRRPDHARLPDIEIIEHVIASIEFLLEIPCVVASPFDFFISVDLAWSRLSYTNNPNRRSAIGDNRRPILGANPANDHVSLLQSSFGTEKNVLRFPECLRLDKIDPVFAFVCLAFMGIEFEVHEGLRNAFTRALRLNATTAEYPPILDVPTLTVETADNLFANHCLFRGFTRLHQSGEGDRPKPISSRSGS